MIHLGEAASGSGSAGRRSRFAKRCTLLDRLSDRGRWRTYAAIGTRQQGFGIAAPAESTVNVDGVVVRAASAAMTSSSNTGIWALCISRAPARFAGRTGGRDALRAHGVRTVRGAQTSNFLFADEQQHVR